jgi:mono/diheme cytochrome c family protein
MNRARVSYFATLLLAVSCAAFAADPGDGAWLQRVPAKEHSKVNPFAKSNDAVAAGRKIYEEHCERCHGEQLEGSGRRPALRSERIQQQATEGDLHWLLVNGSMKKGMPSWSRLGDPQIWQVISYLKSLQPK